MHTKTAQKFKPFVFPEPCECGGELHIRLSQIHRNRFVILCDKFACDLIGYGASVPEAISHYEEILTKRGKENVYG